MDVHLQKIELAVEDESICGTMLLPATAHPGVLFVHGWGGSQAQDLARAREAVGLGCVCLTFDLRGHERTALKCETVTRAQNLADLLAAYDWFAHQPAVDPTSIAVVGISYGGYIATLLTEQRPVRWLALRAPALYKDDNWDLPKRRLHADADLPAYRKRRIEWQDNAVLRAAQRFHGDVLIVESEQDDIIAHAVIENYVAAFATARSLTSRIIAEADHALSRETWQKSYSTTLLNWLTEMIVGARETAAKTKIEAHAENVGL